jgi:hypothetical protein
MLTAPARGSPHSLRSFRVRCARSSCSRPGHAGRTQIAAAEAATAAFECTFGLQRAAVQQLALSPRRSAYHQFESKVMHVGKIRIVASSPPWLPAHPGRAHPALLRTLRQGPGPERRPPPGHLRDHAIVNAHVRYILRTGWPDR